MTANLRSCDYIKYCMCATSDIARQLLNRNRKFLIDCVVGYFTTVWKSIEQYESDYIAKLPTPFPQIIASLFTSWVHWRLNKSGCVMLQLHADEWAISRIKIVVLKKSVDTYSELRCPVCLDINLMGDIEHPKLTPLKFRLFKSCQCILCVLKMSHF